MTKAKNGKSGAVNGTAADKTQEPIKINHGWRQKGKPRSVEITRKLAREFVEMTPAPGDRPYRDFRSAAYIKLAQAGRFRNPLWGRAYCRETGIEYRVNGKHTATMMYEWDLVAHGPYPKLHALIEEYECDTLADVADLYATYDSPSTTRSSGDINRMFAAAVPELAGIKEHMINRYVTGLNHTPQRSQHSTKTLAERADVLLTETAAIVWIDKNLMHPEKERDAKLKMLLRGPIIGAIFKSYKKDPLAALSFWTAVREESDPNNEAPSRKLARFLRTGTMSRQRVRTSRENVQLTDGRELWVKACHAWNAWRKGKPTDLRYYPKAELPEFE